MNWIQMNPNDNELNYVNEQSEILSWKPSSFVTDKVGVNFGLNLRL